VKALRRSREQLIRSTDVGYDFFEHLLWEYYSFKPASSMRSLLGR